MKNAVGDDRRWWAVMPTLPAPAMAGIGQQMEQVGFEGCFSLQIDGAPFVPMAATAATTTTLKVGTRMIGLILDYRLKSWRRRLGFRGQGGSPAPNP